jgi:hypothetical protein
VTKNSDVKTSGLLPLFSIKRILIMTPVTCANAVKPDSQMAVCSIQIETEIEKMILFIEWHKQIKLRNKKIEKTLTFKTRHFINTSSIIHDCINST